MILDKKNELEIIKIRLQKAYSMTIEEQKKWRKKIHELETATAKLEESIGEHFSDEEGIELLINANKELSIELSEKRWKADINKILEQNPKVNEMLNTACDEVDRAFGIKSIEVFKLKIDNYKKAFFFIEKSYADSFSLGVRELTPDEGKEINKDLDQIGWR